jgi:hypothetical protein
MVTLANRLKEGLGRFGYEYNQSSGFSVEITDKLVIVSEKIDLSPLTKEKDKLSLLFHLSGSRLGGPLYIDCLSASIYRYPKHQNAKTVLPPQLIMDKNYFAQTGAIPTRDQLYETVATRLNIKNTLTSDFLNNTGEGLFKNNDRSIRIRGSL